MISTNRILPNTLNNEQWVTMETFVNKSIVLAMFARFSLWMCSVWTRANVFLSSFKGLNLVFFLKHHGFKFNGLCSCSTTPFPRGKMSIYPGTPTLTLRTVSTIYLLNSGIPNLSFLFVIKLSHFNFFHSASSCSRCPLCTCRGYVDHKFIKSILSSSGGCSGTRWCPGRCFYNLVKIHVHRVLFWDHRIARQVYSISSNKTPQVGAWIVSPLPKWRWILRDLGELCSTLWNPHVEMTNNGHG